VLGGALHVGVWPGAASSTSPPATIPSTPSLASPRLASRLRMRVAHGRGQNHWELLLSGAGAKLVAGELRHALAGPQAGLEGGGTEDGA
jgi:hypothetical protein